MKSKPRSKGILDNKKTPAKKNGAEEKLHAAMQKLRNNPSVILGALVIAYCVIRLVFSI